MAFTITDFEDLVRLLGEHPEWRERLRPLVLGERWEAIPDRLDRIEQILQELAEHQAAFEARQASFEDRQTAFEARQAEFEVELRRLTASVQELVRVAQLHDGRQGNLDGQLLELRYERHAASWLTPYLRRIRILSIDELDGLDAAVERGALTAEQLRRLIDLDLIVQGQEAGQPADTPATLLAVEVSTTINVEDIDRVVRGAELLRIGGYHARALVGGYRITDLARAEAEGRGVIVDLHRPKGSG